MRVCSHDCGNFAAIRDQNVLIYWPHGFGDFVGLGYVLPFLHPSNRYWITRFVDHSTALMEGIPKVTPVYAGWPPPAEISGYSGEWHFGLKYSQVDGAIHEVWLPPTLLAVCRRERISVLLWSSYPEVHGREPFPYHSKARNLIRHLAGIEPHANQSLNEALKNSIAFDVCPWAMRWVESRLRNHTDFGRRQLCIVSRTGYSSHGKNWGHRYRDASDSSVYREGEECREFMRLMLRKNSRWMFLAMEDRLFANDDTVRSRQLNCFSYAEVFGLASEVGMPFAVVMKALLNLASLSIGVPTGPFHLSMAKPGLPTVGIWIEHLPAWYDEPKSTSIHVIGRSVYDRMAGLPGCFVSRAGLYYRTIASETPTISGELALAAVEQIMA